MDTDAPVQKYHARLGYQVLKWTVFSVELLLLGLLLIITFLVPVIPGIPRGKLPDIALFALLSAASALTAGALFLKGSKRSAMSLANLISTPPCIVGITVITIVVIPIFIGFLRGR